MVILSPTQGSCGHHSYTTSFLVSNCIGTRRYYSLAQEMIFQIPWIRGRNQPRGEYSGILFHCFHGFTREAITKPYTSRVPVPVAFIFPSRPLSLCCFSKTAKSLVAEHLFLCTCAIKRNGLLSQLKSPDAVLDHEKLLDLGLEQIAAYARL